MKTEEDKYSFNKIHSIKDQNKNQLTETIFQRQKFKIQELLNEKHNTKNIDKSFNDRG